MNKIIDFPKISNDLAKLVDGYPYKLKTRTNGMVFEQRLYLMARCFHETNLEVPEEEQETSTIESAQLLQEAEDLLLKYGKSILSPFLVKNLYLEGVKKRAIQVLMVWKPDWQTIINNLAGTEFEMGRNRWNIVGYYHDENSKDRSGVRIHCRIIGFIDGSSNIPQMPLGGIYLLGTHQVEYGLQRKLA